MSWKTILKGLSEKEKNDTSAKLRQELINAKDLTNQQTKEIKKRISKLKNTSDSMFPFEVQYLRARIAGKTDMQALTEIYNKNKRGD